MNIDSFFVKLFLMYNKIPKHAHRKNKEIWVTLLADNGGLKTSETLPSWKTSLSDPFTSPIKLAKEKGLKTVLIFEDDNKPLDNFNKRWNTIKHWLDSNLDKWEIFNGGARFEGWGDITNEDIPESCKNIKLVNNIDNKEYLFTNDRILSTNWIYINSSVYNKILKWETQINQMFFNPSKDAIDRYITNLKEFNVQFCIPLLALQQSGKSDTDNIHADYDKKDRLIINIYKKIYDKYVYNK